MSNVTTFSGFAVFLAGLRALRSRGSQTVLLSALIASSSSACSATPAPAAPAASDSSAPSSSSAPSNPSAAPDPIGDPAGQHGISGEQAAAKGSTIASVDAREDAQWIQADDYFVASRAFDKGWLNLEVAKMKEPASASNKGEALFFMIRDGRDQRSAYFYRTRPAVRADLVLGNLLICFDDNNRGNVYNAPRDKDNARPGGWWMAKITDLSDLGKGYATLSGSYHCAPDALRAIVK